MDKLKQIMAKIESRVKSRNDEKNKPNELTQERDLSENSVTKSNSLARGYYRFNLVEKRVMEALISQLNPLSKDTLQLQKLELTAVDYANTFGVSEKHAYEHIESAVSGLMGRVFSVAIPKGREEFTLMSNAQYIEGEGRITCSFNTYITSHLVGLRQRFSTYPLSITANFKSSYTWRIYEILVSWAKDPKLTDGIMAGWCTIEINELREMLGVPKSYQWCHVQDQVLDISKKELFEKSNIQLEVERIKTGRKITHLKFTFAEIKT
jgi:plasmid replication initiation protein